jgi:hypothetical protein
MRNEKMRCVTYCMMKLYLYADLLIQWNLSSTIQFPLYRLNAVSPECWEGHEYQRRVWFSLKSASRRDCEQHGAKYSSLLLN